MCGILGILQKMKEGAENVERKIQAKVESLKNANENDKGKSLIVSICVRVCVCFPSFSTQQIQVKQVVD